MAYEHISCVLADGVATLTLMRPDVLNSFNRAMALELQDALGAVGADPEVRAVILTGSGRAFCAGQDLSEAAAPPGEPLPDLGNIVRDSYNPLIRLIRSMEKPVICAVNGVAAGAGANLALACDIVLAAEEASFIQGFSKIGLIPDTGGSWVLPRLVGFHRAAAMMMLGDKVPAARAHELGMVYEVVPGEGLVERATEMACKLAAEPTRGLGLTKKALNLSAANSLDAQLELEEELQRECGETEDFREGVSAFLEKRKPEFKGR
jgi:2-(1,2-epoxy-1,2-dihydrophenyl)acetyl-CoA isomerase